jgi:hypothetical protein
MVASVDRVAVTNTKIEIATLVDYIFSSLLNFIRLEFLSLDCSETSKPDPYAFWKL